MSRAEDAIKQFLEDLEKIDTGPKAKPLPRKPEAEIVPWPKPLSEIELERRQRIIDACWERVQAQRRALEEARGSHHVGPGDPDYKLT
jgi:hypothetical protein